MTTRSELEQDVERATATLSEAQAALNNFNSLAENNVYETLQLALNAVEAQLLDRAYSACEGAGNCGLSEYTQMFMVDNVKHIGTLHVEYNRHDKTYYYVDEHQFSFSVLA